MIKQHIKYLLITKRYKRLLQRYEYYYIKNALELFSLNSTSTCSFVDVDREIPLKSAFTGYFLWFLFTKTAVLNLFKELLKNV